MLASRNDVYSLVCPYIEAGRKAKAEATRPPRIDPKSLLQQLSITDSVQHLGSTTSNVKQAQGLPEASAKLPPCVRRRAKTFKFRDLLAIQSWLVDNCPQPLPGILAEHGKSHKSAGTVAVEQYLKTVLADPACIAGCLMDFFDGDIEASAGDRLQIIDVLRQCICRLPDACLNALASSAEQLTPNATYNVTVWSTIFHVYGLVAYLSLQELAPSTSPEYKAIYCEDISLNGPFHRFMTQQILAISDPRRSVGGHKCTMAYILEGVLQHFTDPSAFVADAPRSTIGQRFMGMLRNWITMMQTFVMKNWNGSVFVTSSGLVGRTLEILNTLWKTLNIATYDLLDFDLSVPQVYSYLDIEAACFSWQTHIPIKATRHIFSFPAMFKSTARFEFFRTCCHLRMRRSVKEATFATNARRKILHQSSTDMDESYLDRRMKIVQRHYLVLDVRRDTLLSDALNQVWQREHRELFKPLRIRLGSDNGEIGHDLGGVQVEFFNLLCAEICDSDKSIFYTDPTTRLSWFRAGSLEPLHRYETLGVLIGLAVYNGITLPVSFPLAFYTKLMGIPVSEDHLKDGWPALQRSFNQLLQYHGDVETDLAMDYSFTADLNGVRLSIDMNTYDWRKLEGNPVGQYQSSATVHAARRDSEPVPQQIRKSNGASPESSTTLASDAITSEAIDVNGLSWPGWRFTMSEPGYEPKPVTDENREDYIKTYTAWVLDYSIRPQFHAFTAGFYRVADLRATRLMTPADFKLLVEGTKTVTVADLKKFATYENTTATSQRIEWFWSIVETYPEEKLRRLLEFVTASRRLPPAGAEGLRFVIAENSSEAKANALPGSSTCFGMLHMPAYESKKVMAKKLDIALEHSLGFGQA